MRGLELLLLLVTSVVSAATRALGAPVFAFSVLPAVAALMVTSRLSLVFPLALLLGALSGAGGYLAAFVLEFPVGASQTAVAVALVLLAAPFKLLRR